MAWSVDQKWFRGEEPLSYTIYHTDTIPTTVLCTLRKKIGKYSVDNDVSRTHNRNNEEFLNFLKGDF
jgi:hypothetical protein